MLLLESLLFSIIYPCKNFYTSNNSVCVGGGGGELPSPTVWQACSGKSPCYIVVILARYGSVTCTAI